MASKHRDLLEVLKLELEFLKSGGYGKPLSWRPQHLRGLSHMLALWKSPAEQAVF